MLLARRSAYINTTDVLGLDERFLDPLAAHPFGVFFLARAIRANGPILAAVLDHIGEPEGPQL
jgi:hypothetical protein